jgi:pimeloyl-ACP methyl ester carboxylesterase
MFKSSAILVALLVPGLIGLSGCALNRQAVSSYVPAAGSERGVVFAVDGAGGFQASTAALRDAIEEEGLALRVEPVVWQHGWGRILADQTDYPYARAQGQQLAERVAAYRRSCPGGEIYLIGHSAGCAVVLAAVEALPPATVDRVVLLAPSLSAGYDLRPALRGVRCTLEVFCSRRDWFYLGLGTTLLGTADRQWSAASGRVGFCPVIASPADQALYAKLRQHPWHMCLAWTGNWGGHYGGYQPRYLRTFVLPLFQTPHGPNCH